MPSQADSFCSAEYFCDGVETAVSEGRHCEVAVQAQESFLCCDQGRAEKRPRHASRVYIELCPHQGSDNQAGILVLVPRRCNSTRRTCRSDPSSRADSIAQVVGSISHHDHAHRRVRSSALLQHRSRHRHIPRSLCFPRQRSPVKLSGSSSLPRPRTTRTTRGSSESPSSGCAHGAGNRESV